MQNSGLNIDLQAIAQSLKETIGNFGGFSPEQIREAAMSESTLRHAVLRALKEDSKTGHQVIQAIKDESKLGIAPRASSVYPMLESLVDTELVSVAIKKDRKVFSITKLGKAELSSDSKAASGSDTDAGTAGATESAWALPKWVDLQGTLPRASARLAAVAIDVAKNGTREQQQAAATIIDEARRQIHKLLSEG